MHIRIRLPTHLDLYTEGEREFSVHVPDAARLDDVLRAADARFPGLRFRVINEQDCIRRHIKIFVAAQQVTNLTYTLQDGQEVLVVAALSGG